MATYLRRHGHFIVLLSVIVLAFCLRVMPLHSTVFTGNGTTLLENDPYYHIHLAEYLQAHFPAPLTRDPFIGGELPYFPLLSYLIMIPASMLDCSLESWAAWIPPLAFIAVLVVAYLLGKVLIGKWAGVLAAAIVALLPTELYNRSLLGFADHHVLEVLFVSMMFLYLLYAEKTLRVKKYGLLGGMALALYIWCWKGFPLYLLIFTAVTVATLLLQKERNKTLCDFHLISGSVGMVALAPLFFYYKLSAVYPVAVFLYTVAPYVVAWLLSHMRVRWVISILAVVAAGGLFAFRDYVTWTLMPATRVGATISEATPAGTYILVIMGVAIIPFVAGLWVAMGRRTPYLVAALWSLAAVFMFAIQMRWSYYFSVPFAMVTVTGVYAIVAYMKERVKLGAAIALTFFVLMPGIVSTPQITDAKPLYTPEIREAVTWLGGNSPEDAVVASWWPNGFFIIYGAHRVPVTDPTQRDADIAARFFLHGIGDFEYVLIDDAMVDTFPGMVQTLGGTWAEGEAVYNMSFMKSLLDGTDGRYTKVFENDKVWIWERVE